MGPLSFFILFLFVMVKDFVMTFSGAKNVDSKITQSGKKHQVVEKVTYVVVKVNPVGLITAVWVGRGRPGDVLSSVKRINIHIILIRVEGVCFLKVEPDIVESRYREPADVNYYVVTSYHVRGTLKRSVRWFKRLFDEGCRRPPGNYRKDVNCRNGFNFKLIRRWRSFQPTKFRTFWFLRLQLWKCTIYCRLLGWKRRSSSLPCLK